MQSGDDQNLPKKKLSKSARNLRGFMGLIDPRTWLHAAKLVNFYSYSHVQPLRLIKKGRDLKISPTATFSNGQNIVLGDRVLVGENVRLWAGLTDGTIAIGHDTGLGPNCVITVSNYRFRQGSPIMDQPLDQASVTIGHDVWVGANCVLLPGCDIGQGCVIAAGSVVRGTFGPNLIVGGVPAKVLGDRVIETK